MALLWPRTQARIDVVASRARQRPEIDMFVDAVFCVVPRRCNGYISRLLGVGEEHQTAVKPTTTFNNRYIRPSTPSQQCSPTCSSLPSAPRPRWLLVPCPSLAPSPALSLPRAASPPPLLAATRPLPRRSSTTRFVVASTRSSPSLSVFPSTSTRSSPSCPSCAASASSSWASTSWLTRTSASSPPRLTSTTTPSACATWALPLRRRSKPLHLPHTPTITSTERPSDIAYTSPSHFHIPLPISTKNQSKQPQSTALPPTAFA